MCGLSGVHSIVHLMNQGYAPLPQTECFWQVEPKFLANTTGQLVLLQYNVVVKQRD